MTSEIAYNISTSSGPDPGRSLTSVLPKQNRTEDGGSSSNVLRLNRPGNKDAAQGADQKRDATGELFMKSIQKEFDLINKVELKFNTDKETGQTYIKIVDKDSGDVVREIPPEFMRKLAEKMDEMVGILFDQKA